jgi:hypothetical protein
MKKLVEVKDEGLESLLDAKVILFCANYFYAGTLVGVNRTFVKLAAKDAEIVYETGSFSDSRWQNSEKLGSDCYVRIQMIEAWARGK